MVFFKPKNIVIIFFIFLFITGRAYGAAFTDDLGRVIELHTAPMRIISLAPGITEILFSLGLGDRVVGVTDFCNYPEEALTKRSVGGLNSNLEVILSLRPDLVIGTAGVYQEEKIIQFDRLQIPFFILDPTSLPKVLEMIQVISTMAGVPSQGLHLAEALNRRWKTLKENVKRYPLPRVLYVVDKNPLFSVGKKSFLNDLIKEAGGENITRDLDSAYPLVSMEFVLQKDPEVIILPLDKGQTLTPQGKRYWVRWATLSAVRKDRIYAVNRDLLSRPGPRVIEGLEQLARLLHPGLEQRETK